MSWLPTFMLASNFVSTLGQARLEKSQAKIEKAALRGQAAIADANARLGERAASDAIYRGQTQEMASRLETGRLKASTKTSAAANGIAVDSDNVINALTEIDVFGDIESTQIAANALREAWGHRIEAVSATNEGRNARFAADQISPNKRAASTLLTGGSKLLRQRDAMQRVGMINKGDLLYSEY